MSLLDPESTLSCSGRLSAQKPLDSCIKEGDTSSSGPLSQACPPELHRGLSVAPLPLAELLCCPGCSTFLQHPVSLPCGHCLCPACLATLRKKQACKPALVPADTASINATPALVEPLAACPRCQASYPLLPGAAWSFPANVLLAQTAQRLLDAHPELRQPQRRVPHLRALFSASASLAPCPLPVMVGARPSPCELCAKRRPAQNYCATCRLHYCAKCLRKLHGNPAYGAHTLAEPVQEAERELCPVHAERSLTHFCQSDGTLGCHGCMVQSDGGHHGHLVAPLSEARISSETALCQALEHANKVQQQCDSDWEQMEALAARVSSGSAELRRSIRHGFLSLRNALLDQEAALLSHLDTLSSSTDAVAQTFLQSAGPLRGSLAGLSEIGKEALLEPRASVFLQGAAGLARWLGALSAEMPRPDTHLLPAGYQPLAGAELHFDELLNDLQSLMGKHLRWMPVDTDNTVAMPTAIATEMIGEEAGEAGEKELGEEQQQQEEAGVGREVDVDVDPRPGTPSLGSEDEEEPLVTEEDLGMPAGDGAREAKALLLPRPPILYQHNAYGTTVEVFWMVPMGEEVHSFDVHVQDASVGVATGQGVMMGGVKGCSLQTSGLRGDTQYLFRARSINEHGHGAWSPTYRVNTSRSEEEEKEEEQRTTPAQEA